MKKYLLLILCFACQSLYAVKITHGPYICDMDSSSVTIVWITDKPGLSWVEYDVDGEDHFYAKERIKVYDVRHGRRILTDTVHQVRITGLTPDTRYRYRVLTKEVATWSIRNILTYGGTADSGVYKKEPYRFKTFPTTRGSLTFVVYNDIHERAADLKEMSRNIDFDKVDFVVLNGDMQHSVESQDQICRSFLDTCVSMFASRIPVFMVRGNHETRGKFADSYMRYFPMENDYYYVRTISGIDFLMLDSGEDKPDSDFEYNEIADFDNYRVKEAEWIASLAETGRIGKRPLIVFSHIPFFEATWHGNLHLIETILPVLNNLHVSVMFSGHTHRYGYTAPDEKIFFPNLTNSNTSYLLCRIIKNKIEVDYVCDSNGKNNKHFTFPLQ